MMQFMENVVIITAFSVIVIAFLALIVIGVLESYDAITGADAKRQADKERLRQLEDEL